MKKLFLYLLLISSCLSSCGVLRVDLGRNVTERTSIRYAIPYPQGEGHKFEYLLHKLQNGARLGKVDLGSLGEPLIAQTVSEANEDKYWIARNLPQILKNAGYIGEEEMEAVEADILAVLHDWYAIPEGILIDAGHNTL